MVMIQNAKILNSATYFVDKASRLDMGWKIFPNGVVTVIADNNYSLSNPKGINLLERLSENKSLLAKIHNEYDGLYVPKGLHYIAQGDLKEKIIDNFAEKYKKLAQEKGYGSISEMVVNENKDNWKNKDGAYIIIDSVNMPLSSDNKDMLNFLKLNKAIMLEKEKMEFGVTTFRHYVAGESLSKIIAKELKEIPSSEVNDLFSYRTARVVELGR